MNNAIIAAALAAGLPLLGALGARLLVNQAPKLSGKLIALALGNATLKKLLLEHKAEVKAALEAAVAEAERDLDAAA